MRLFGTVRIFEALKEGYKKEKKNTKFLFVFYVLKTDSCKLFVEQIGPGKKIRNGIFFSEIVRLLEQLI